MNKMNADIWLYVSCVRHQQIRFFWLLFLLFNSRGGAQHRLEQCSLCFCQPEVAELSSCSRNQLLVAMLKFADWLKSFIQSLFTSVLQGKSTCVYLFMLILFYCFHRNNEFDIRTLVSVLYLSKTNLNKQINKYIQKYSNLVMID